MKHSKILLILLASTSLLLVNCAKNSNNINVTDITDNEKYARIYHSQWVFTELQEGLYEADLKKLEKPATLNIKKESFNGYSGCNNFFGEFGIKNNKIKNSKVGSTKMMCPKEFMEIEQIILKLLSNPSKYAIKDNKLILKQGNIKAVLECCL